MLATRRLLGAGGGRLAYALQPGPSFTGLTSVIAEGSVSADRSRPKAATCLRRSTSGSRRASTRPILRTRGHCWTSSPEGCASWRAALPSVDPLGRGAQLGDEAATAVTDPTDIGVSNRPSNPYRLRGRAFPSSVGLTGAGGAVEPDRSVGGTRRQGPVAISGFILSKSLHAVSVPSHS